MKYNYLETVKEDVKEYIKENYNNVEDINKDDIYDELFICDSVTGNASGSYTMNTWKAEENLAHNWDLLEEALKGFGYEPIIDLENHGAEYYDVTIRCYLLNQVIDEVLEELKN